MTYTKTKIIDKLTDAIIEKREQMKALKESANSIRLMDKKDKKISDFIEHVDKQYANNEYIVQGIMIGAEKLAVDMYKFRTELERKQKESDELSELASEIEAESGQ